MGWPRLAAILLALALGTVPAGAEVSPLPPGKTVPPAATPIPDLDAPTLSKPGSDFGVPVTLRERTVIYLQGESKWESAQETLVEAFKLLGDYLDKHAIKPDGAPMTIYTETSDAGFRFRAAVPIAEPPKDPPKGDIAVGQTPGGKALKFVHRGNYEALDATYEAITDYLDDKGIDAKDVFVEEYASGPLQAGDGGLVIYVFVPVK